ncbi:g5746 [Coccomyxa elongata]
MATKATFQQQGSSTMNSKTRVAVCLLFVAALLACSATATVSTTVEGDNVAALPTVLPVVNLGRKLASDGGSKAGPPPVKCTYAKGPKGINKVCN